MAYRIEYYRGEVKVASLVSQKLKGDAQADALFGLGIHGADRAIIRDLHDEHSVVATVRANHGS